MYDKIYNQWIYLLKITKNISLKENPRFICVLDTEFHALLLSKLNYTATCYITSDEGPSLETSIFPLSFQVVREPLPFAYH